MTHIFRVGRHLSSPGKDGDLARLEVEESERGAPSSLAGRWGRSHQVGYATDRAIQSRSIQLANLGVALGGDSHVVFHQPRNPAEKRTGISLSAGQKRVDTVWRPSHLTVAARPNPSFRRCLQLLIRLDQKFIFTPSEKALSSSPRL